VELSAGNVLARDRRGFLGSIGKGAALVGETSWQVVKSLGRVFGPQGIGRIVDLLFGGAKRTISDPTSLVGGGRLAAQAAQAGVGDILFQLLAVFNVFVGILNLLPIPPFDGGHLAVLAVEKVRGKKVDPRRLVPLTAVVAVFLILFMVSVLYLDIVKPLPNPFR
jgi:membrane-associated protease RseP (regulator of RpoE activity)